jgi:hypothetical protein
MGNVSQILFRSDFHRFALLTHASQDARIARKGGFSGKMGYWYSVVILAE